MFKRKIADFFDINDRNHLRSFKFYLFYQRWPTDFLPSDVPDEILSNWQMIIKEKMAMAWLDEKTKV